MSKGEKIKFKNIQLKTYENRPLVALAVWCLCPVVQVHGLWVFSSTSELGRRREKWTLPLNSCNETRCIEYDDSNRLGVWRWGHVLLFLGSVTLGMMRHAENPARHLDASLGILAMPPWCPDTPGGPHLMTGKQNIQTLDCLFRLTKETLSWWTRSSVDGEGHWQRCIRKLIGPPVCEHTLEPDSPAALTVADVTGSAFRERVPWNPTLIQGVQTFPFCLVVGTF